MKTLNSDTIKKLNAFIVANPSHLALIYGIMHSDPFTYVEALQEWAEDKSGEISEVANILLSDPAYMGDSCDLFCLDSAFSEF